jgi:hypothetical protein
VEALVEPDCWRLSRRGIDRVADGLQEGAQRRAEEDEEDDREQRRQGQDQPVFDDPLTATAGQMGHVVTTR